MSTIVSVATQAISLDGLTKDTGLGNGLYDGSNTISGAATTWYTVPIPIINKDTVAFQVSCIAAGSPNGSYSLQGSLDQSAQEGNMQPDGNLTHWSTLSFWDEASGAWVQSKAVSGASSFISTIQVSGPRWIRLVWTNTTGSANLVIKAATKSDGGR